MAPILLALANLAPSLLQFIGKGDAAEVAKKAVDVAKAVTGTDTPETALEALRANPDAVLAYQKAILEQQSEFARLAVRQEEIAAADRGSAREREIKTGDRTPAWLAFFVTIGFFGVLGYLLTMGKPMAGGDALLVMLGSLGTAWMAIISYYFGSSSSSRSKDETIGRLSRP